MVNASIGAAGPTRLARSMLGHDILLWTPIPLGLLISVLSLAIGAHADYIIVQLIIFLLAVPLLYIVKYDDRYTSTILLISFMKIFYISQFVGIFFLSAPDTNLSEPLPTITGIAVGLTAGMIGIGLARLVIQLAPRGEPILRMNVTPRRLRRLGYLSAAIGLPAQLIWTWLMSRLTGEQHGGLGQVQSGLVIFAYLSNLDMLSLACFTAAELIDTKGRTFISRPFLALLAIYLAATAPLAAKAAPLAPLVVVFATALQFGWKFRWTPVLISILIFAFVSEVMSPVVTYSRMTAFGERLPVPVVFATTLARSLIDPSELAYVRSYSLDQGRANSRMYYGRPAGLLDRFTPERTDKLVTSSRYIEPVGPSIFGDALAAVLPQSLGFKRDVTASSRRDEGALFRHQDELGKVSWENAGYIGDGFIVGGLPMATMFMFLFGFLSSLAARMSFGARRRSVFWLLLMPLSMLFPADQTFVGTVPVYFWPWVILVTVVFGLMWWLGRDDPGLTDDQERSVADDQQA
jgi:hypothetical protein